MSLCVCVCACVCAWVCVCVCGVLPVSPGTATICFRVYGFGLVGAFCERRIPKHLCFATCWCLQSLRRSFAPGTTSRALSSMQPLLLKGPGYWYGRILSQIIIIIPNIETLHSTIQVLRTLWVCASPSKVWLQSTVCPC